jgi:2-keto-4-pentenoate hydratase
MAMTQDGKHVSWGHGAACLGSPLTALQWLARVAAELGDPLQAGEVILSGALGPMVTVKAGSTYEAQLTGLGTVRAIFAPDRER